MGETRYMTLKKTNPDGKQMNYLKRICGMLKEDGTI